MKHPWMKFYPSDWRADPALRTCSIGARGLWTEILCLMHDAKPCGSLLVNGNKLTDKQLASLAGITEKETAAFMEELEAAGVFSRDDDGTVYSRRMRRDQERAERDKAYGLQGGNPTLKGVDKAQKLETRNQNPERKKDSGADAPTPKAKREKRRAVQLPEGFLLNFEYGIEQGLTLRETEREAQKFRNHAAQNGRTCVDWVAAWRNWCLKAAEFMDRTPVETGKVVPFGFNAEFGSKQLDAWDEYAKALGRPTYPRDKKGGWNFPTEWPPDIPQAEAAE